MRRLLAGRFDPSDFAINIQGRTFSQVDLDRSRYSNLSVYLFQSHAFYSAVEQLSTDNAQGEEYLTDTVGILAAQGRPVRLVPIRDPHHVMEFNTREELAAIEAWLAAHER